MTTRDFPPTVALEEEYEPFLEATLQFEEAARELDLESCVVQRLRHTEREVSVNLTLVRDNGQATTFTGLRVQHSTRRGPCLGGMRFSPDAHLSELKALAMNRTWQCALLDIPMGGSAGAIVCDPAKLSERELRRLSKDYVYALRGTLGPLSDVLMGDAGCNQLILAWMLDGYARAVGHLEPGVVTGKPAVLFGLPDHADSTARGLLLVLEQALEEGRKKARGGPKTWSGGAAPLAGLRVAIQGFDKLGAAAARLLEENGARVIAVADVSGGIYREEGLDVCAVADWVESKEVLLGYPEAQGVSNAEVLACPCDLLVLAAGARQITTQNAEQVRARWILEAAHAAITQAADRNLEQRGVTVIPDLLATAGGTAAAYLEWSRNVGHEGLLLDGVEEHLRHLVLGASRAVQLAARRNHASLRRAAHLVAVERVAAALRLL